MKLGGRIYKAIHSTKDIEINVCHTLYFGYYKDGQFVYSDGKLIFVSERKQINKFTYYKGIFKNKNAISYKGIFTICQNFKQGYELLNSKLKYY